jgi:tape measure domain-containing protein
VSAVADLGNVRIKADTTEIVKAAKDIDGMAKAAGRARDKLGRFIPATDRASDSADGLNRSTGKARDSLGRFVGTGDKATRTSAKLGNELDVLRNAFASLGVALVVREMAQMTMQMQAMENVLKVATGSSAGAAAEMQFLREEADRLGFNLQVVGKQFGQFAAAAKGTALEGQAAREVFTAVAEASRALGLSSEQTEGALNALQQMISKGNVQAEELRGQLGERIPGAFNMAARAMGVTTQELNKMLEQGEVLAEDLLPKLAVEMRTAFGQGAQDAAGSLAAEIGRFQTQMFELGAGVGTQLLPEMTAFVKLMTDLLRIAADNTEVIGNLVRVVGLLVAMNLVGWASRGAVALGQLALGLRGAAAGATLLSRGLTILGGPVGIIFGVAAATLMLSDRFRESSEMAKTYAGGIDALRQRFDELGESQRELMRLEVSDELRKEQQQFEALQRQIATTGQEIFNLAQQGGGVDPVTGQSLSALERQMVELNAAAEQSAGKVEELQRFLDDTAESADRAAGATQAAANATTELSDAEKKLAEARGRFNQTMMDAQQNLADERALTAALAESEEAYRRLSAEQRINATVRQQINALAEAGATNLEEEAQALTQLLQLQLREIETQQRLRDQASREQQVASDLDALRVSLQQISPEAKEYAESIQTITQAFETGAIATQAEFDAILGQLKDRFNEATAQADPFSDAWGSAMSSLESAFTDFIMNGLDDFDSFADAVMGITKRLVAEIITEFAKAQIGKVLGNVIGGGTGGGSIGGQVLGSVAGEGLKNLLGFGAPAAAAAPAASAFAAPSIPMFGGATSIAGAGTAAASGGIMSSLAAAAGPIALGIGAFALLGGLFGGSKKRQQEKAQRDQILAREEELRVQLASIDGLEDLTLQRERELEKLSPANREIQERVYALEDEIRITRERRSLEERAFRLIGDTASLRRRELAQTEEVNRGILRYIYAVEDAQERVSAAQDKVSQAEQRVTRAFDAVRRAVEAQEAQLLDQRREIEDRQRELDQQFTTRIDMLDSALERMRSNLGSAMTPFAEREMAKAVLDVVLASGINAVDEDTLRQALDVVASPSESLFATFQDYAREFVKTQNTLEAIKADAEQSLSVEEKLAAEQIAKLDQQIDLGRQQLEAAQRQVDAAFGIDNSVKSVEEAMRGLTAAIGGLASARGGLASAESALASLISRGPPAGAPIASAPAGPSGPAVSQLQAAGRLAVRGPLTLGEENTWRSEELKQLRAVGLNLGSRSYASRTQIESLRQQVRSAGGMPSFADGGMHMGGMRLVGERGPELEATGPSRILSNRDLMSAIGGGGSAESMEAIRSEIRGLRSELARTQYKIERNTRRTSDTLTIWDADGLPAERT